MARVLDLTPAADAVITIKKGDREVSFPDRIPAALVPTLLGLINDDNSISFTPDNITKLTDIFVALIQRANPEMAEREILHFLDIQDLPDLAMAVLNPQALSSTPTSATTESSSTETSTKKRR